MSPHVTFIAEAGVNHNGSLARALEMVDVAAAAGADVVKFQTFSADAIATKSAPKAAYQIQETGARQSQYEMLKALELDKKAHEALIARCVERDIEFLSTPFDLPSLKLLAEDLQLKRLKVGSGELTNAPLLLALAETGCDVILSTGMSALQEVRAALEVLAFGYTRNGSPPETDAFKTAFESAEGQAALSRHVTLLHCTSAYPTPDEDINLAAIGTLRDVFGLAVGFSDHSTGVDIPIASVAVGASMIEKHFTLDRGLPGPDHKASLEPGELSALVKSVRRISTALGNGVKAPRPSEEANIPIGRKSLVAARPIAEGELFTEDNLTVKRPGTGLSPLAFWSLLGKPAPRAFAPDELIGL
ncbi:N-acetylneuraminate synthase [Tepidicaulis sp.]|uniref:N-acetylneuraminate synthase n=1 Tax=Tepidicaulis sp. TaxID=1920809 RepID=UPI003B5ADFDE